MQVCGKNYIRLEKRKNNDRLRLMGKLIGFTSAKHETLRDIKNWFRNNNKRV